MRKRIIAAVLMLLLMLTTATPVYAGQNTTYTYTISVDNEWTRTHDAYMGGGVCLKDAGLEKPTDLFWKDDFLYIADSGNGRIVRYNLKNETIEILGEGSLVEPRGLFVADDGTIYVADAGAPAVFLLETDGSLRKKIERPDSYLFSSQSVFTPTNVVVTKQGNIFVSGEGAHEGLMQFSQNGEFQGYFAANKRNLSLLEKVQELIFTDAQINQLLSRRARAIQNIDISEDDLIYSVTQDAGLSLAWSAAEEKTENRLKLHNLAGTNILSPNHMIADEWNFVDVASGMYDCIYTLTYTGIINEYDSSGNLIFSFGGRSVSDNLNGTFTYASAIDVDDDGILYVLDKEQALVQMFYPNEFAMATHKALYYLEKGEYAESEQLWLDLLKMNGMSRLAHLGYGKTLFYQQRYKEALKQFEIANEKELYSECFWELRDTFINDHVIYFLIGIVLLLMMYKGIRVAVKRFGKEGKRKRQNAFVRNLHFAWSMLRHPIDGFDDAKRENGASVASATCLYLGVITVFIVDMLFRGFIFNHNSAEDANLLMMLATIVVPIALWVIGNYMIASINDGEGTLKQVYIGTAYAFTPYIFLTPVIIALSYVLTLNEAFIIQFGYVIILGWTIVLLIQSVVYIHDYTGKETLKSILITIFFMVMAIVAFAILYLVWMQVYDFLDQVKEELIYRVQK